MIEAVFFDGDQTLWDFEALMRRALAATLVELQTARPGAVTSSLTVESMVADRRAVEVTLRATNLEERRLAAFGRTLHRLGLFEKRLAEHLNEFYLEHRFRGVQLYPDVLPALTALRQDFPLGLLSNGNGYPEHSGLAGMFAVVVFSQDHGFDKPDRRLFDIAAAQLGAPAGGLAMIGDSIVNDVAGAQGAGWRGLWLNRDNVVAPAEVRPDATLTTLRDAPAVLADLTAPSP